MVAEALVRFQVFAALRGLNRETDTIEALIDRGSSKVEVPHYSGEGVDDDRAASREALMAAMCACEVPQQPPMRRTPRSSQRGTVSANEEGESRVLAEGFERSGRFLGKLLQQSHRRGRSWHAVDAERGDLPIREPAEGFGRGFGEAEERDDQGGLVRNGERIEDRERDFGGAGFPGSRNRRRGQRER